MILKLSQIPELASEHGATVDAMNEFVHWFMTILFIGWSVFLVYVWIRYRRKRNPTADYTGVRTHASTHVEVGVVIVEAILLIGFAFPFWSQRTTEFPTGSEVVHVRAVGYQFGWAFHYPGPDGIFGSVSPDNFIKDAAGLDREDPNGKDDIVSLGTLMLPTHTDRPS